MNNVVLSDAAESVRTRILLFKNSSIGKAQSLSNVKISRYEQTQKLPSKDVVPDVVIASNIGVPMRSSKIIRYKHIHRADLCVIGASMLCFDAVCHD
jgi:hypothetical protein